MLYKVCQSQIIDGYVELPSGAIPLKVCLMLTKPFKDPDTKLVDGISYLAPVVDKKEEHNERTGTK